MFKKIALKGGGLLKPSAAITDPIQRIKAKLVSFTILLLMILVSISLLAESDLSPLISIGLFLCYLLSRTKYNYISAILAILVNSSFIALPLLQLDIDQLSTASIISYIAWFSSSLILASVILSLRSMIVISVLHVVFPLVLLVLHPNLKLPSLALSIGYTTVIFLLLLVLLLLRDLLEEERLKEIKNKNSELESLVIARTKEIESFAYSIAHDLRAPLRHIVGFSQYLKESTKDKLDSDEEVDLDRILQSAYRMDELIDDLLKLSRISQQDISIGNVNLSAIVAEISDQLKLDSIDREVEFKIIENVSANVDSSLIRIALENLLNNSWKYSMEKSPAIIEFGVNEINSQNVFFIKDNGIGFDQEESGKIFEPFQRLHSSDKYKGSGVGLAIVKKVIERHSGCIWVESKVGKGSVFYFTLSNSGSI